MSKWTTCSTGIRRGCEKRPRIGYPSGMIATAVAPSGRSSSSSSLGPVPNVVSGAPMPCARAASARFWMAPKMKPPKVIPRARRLPSPDHAREHGHEQHGRLPDVVREVGHGAQPRGVQPRLCIHHLAEIGELDATAGLQRGGIGAPVGRLEHALPPLCDRCLLRFVAHDDPAPDLRVPARRSADGRVKQLPEDFVGNRVGSQETPRWGRVDRLQHVERFAFCHLVLLAVSVALRRGAAPCSSPRDRAPRTSFRDPRNAATRSARAWRPAGRRAGGAPAGFPCGCRSCPLCC